MTEIIKFISVLVAILSAIFGIYFTWYKISTGKTGNPEKCATQSEKITVLQEQMKERKINYLDLKADISKLFNKLDDITTIIINRSVIK